MEKLSADERRAICRKAQELPKKKLTEWESGFVHAAAWGVSGMPDSFYNNLQERINNGTV